jgi:hypothetical protein
MIQAEPDRRGNANGNGAAGGGSRSGTPVGMIDGTLFEVHPDEWSGTLNDRRITVFRSSFTGD